MSCAPAVAVAGLTVNRFVRRLEAKADVLVVPLASLANLLDALASVEADLHPRLLLVCALRLDLLGDTEKHRRA